MGWLNGLPPMPHEFAIMVDADPFSAMPVTYRRGASDGTWTLAATLRNSSHSLLQITTAGGPRVAWVSVNLAPYRHRILPAAEALAARVVERQAKGWYSEMETESQ